MSKLSSVLRDHGVGAVSGNSNAPYFGTGADGDLTITAPTLTVAMTTAPIGGNVNNLYDNDRATIFKTNATNTARPTVISVDLGSVRWIRNMWFSGWTDPNFSISFSERYAVRTSVDGINWSIPKDGFTPVDGGTNQLPVYPSSVREFVAVFAPVQARYVALVFNVESYSSRPHWINSFRIGSAHIISVPTEDVTTVVKNYENLSIGADCVLTVDKRCRGLIVYARGNINIAGTVDISGKAAYIDTANLPQITFPVAMRHVMQFDPANNKVIVIPNGGAGGTGGNGGTTLSGRLGGRGGFGGTGTWYGGGAGGGGGGGSADSDSGSILGGLGGKGSAGGGAGGAAVTYNTFKAGNLGQPGAGASGAVACGSNGLGNWQATSGAGGNSHSGGGGGGGGGASNGNGNSTPIAQAGGPGGNYGGGAIILICRGNISIGATGTILANAVGSAGKGGDGKSLGGSVHDVSGGGGGGGAGGGTVTLIHKGTYSNSGSIQVNATSGAAGGAGFYNSAPAVPAGAGAAGTIGSINVYDLNLL
ncbi:hypothetical protein [Tumebacillus lipolyticus]|uniref:F5/8 type C domain-containing protein n=1 Tax=Tumebacillus lipolyticus TaxID=1280370 RepID=A0ABW5A131_9BACL